MSLVFFNTLSRRKEEFKPIVPPQVKLYTCGPTVYDFPHIGNFRTYVFEDVLRRWLLMSGYQVTQVMNLTDVDDKTIRGAREKGIALADYTRPFIQYFFEDLAALRIQKAEYYPRATGHIPEMTVLIAGLLKKGIAYRGEDGSVYYDVSKFPDYGKLARIETGELKAGARVSHDEYDKADASDFALWKAWDPADGNVFWETELGKGRPGWHVECSAMSMKYLGEHFDIHTGGVDNVFPHHQNEIAQSEAFTGRPFVNTWLHAEHLLADGRKMSKSLGNFFTVRDVLAKGCRASALRYFYVSSHYRSKLNFTFAGLLGAQAAVARLSDFLKRLKAAAGGNHPDFEAWVDEARREFRAGMDDDLNTPRAAAAVHELINRVNPALEEGRISSRQIRPAVDFFLWADELLGLGLSETISEEKFLPEVAQMVAEREKARAARDFRKADEIRQALLARGVIVEDTPSGPRCKRAG